MDGQRRLSRQVKVLLRSVAFTRVVRLLQSRSTGFAVRTGAVALLGAAIMGGLVDGRHVLQSGRTPGDRFAALVGLAAQDITIAGLTNHDAEQLLKVIGVRPGSSLIGFDAGTAKRLLEGIDWVEEAAVQRTFPNQLDITLTERKPFAVWQRGMSHYVIDRNGVAMSGIDATRAGQLPLVSGEGANEAAAGLMDDLAVVPEIMLRVGAAARIGQRRWTLYLDNGIKVLLPATHVQVALQRLAQQDQNGQLLSKDIAEVDLRLAGQIRIALAQVIPDVADDAKKKTVE